MRKNLKDARQRADTFKKYMFFKDFLALNVHENANKKLSLIINHLEQMFSFDDKRI